MSFIISPTGYYYPLGMPCTARFNNGCTRQACLLADRMHIEVRFDEFPAWVRFVFTQAMLFVRLRSVNGYLGRDFVIVDLEDTPEWPTLCTLVGCTDPRIEEGSYFLNDLAIHGN